MLHLVRQPCVGRVIPVACSQSPTVRFNSTGLATPGAEAKAGANTASPLPKSPIASSWNNIVIPSREEILRNRDHEVSSKSYHPDLRYLRKTTSTSLASRLARQLDSRPQPRNSVPHISGQPQPREHRIGPAKRNAEHEKSSNYTQRAQGSRVRSRPSGETQRPPHRQHSRQFEGTEGATQRFTQTSTGPPDMGRRSQASRPDSGRRDMNSQWGAPRVDRRGENRVKSRDTSNRIARRTAVSSPRKTGDIEAPDNNGDITFEIILQGGEDRASPDFVAPDPPLVDLDGVFGPSSDAKLEAATVRQVRGVNVNPPVSPDLTQWVRETFGGDYSRYAPQTSADYLTPHRQLGSVKHAQMVLSRRREVALGPRRHAAEIIASSVGEAIGTKVTRL